MAKGMRGRRRSASRQFRAMPYPDPTCKRDVSEDLSEKKCSDLIHHKHDWEDATCSVCMEYPHCAVLLLCSSYDKGCRPYMCGTSCRYSNCLDQYKRAYTKVTGTDHDQALNGAARDTTNSFGGPPVSSLPVEKRGEVGELACPLCRGQVKGYTVVEAAREYLNSKKRTCMEEKCTFDGTYKELRKHVKSKHPSARPRQVDPDHEQKWKRLEREREREDVISTVTSSMPGAVVFGDYVIERSPYGFDSTDDDEEEEDDDEEEEDDDEEEEGFDINALGRNMEGFDNLVDVFLLFQALGRRGGNVESLDGLRRQGDDDVDNNGTSLASRLRRQGRVLLGRSGRRRRRREADGNGGRT